MLFLLLRLYFFQEMSILMTYPISTPSSSLSLCSLLWKLLLALLWMEMAALSLLPCHNPSPGAVEELLSADICERRVKGKRTALWTTCQPVWGTSIQHDHSGLETENRHKAPLKNWGTHWNTVIRWKIHSTGEDAGLPLVRTTSQLL